MAEHIETVEYLCDEVGARPTGTEEEQLAALYIAEKLREETAMNAIVEDFACPSNPNIVKLICFGVGIVAALLSMILPSLGIAWTIIAAAVAAIYALENLKGMNILSKFFRNGISQNVVAKYSPENTTTKRKIVLVASYDTGKDLNGIKKGPIADNIVKIQWACLGGLIASPVFMLIHTVFFASTTGGIVGVFSFLSVICIILMALPLIGVILEGRAPYSQGANNNAAGVSVLLDVAAKVVDGAMEPDETEIEGEEVAREAGAIPEGAEIEYEAPVTQRSLTPEQSLAAAKAAIAAMTGKPIADKVPFTDITTHLVHGDGFDDYNQPVNVHFEVADEPAEITHQSYFGDFDYEQAAAEDEARAVSRPATKPAPVPAASAEENENKEPVAEAAEPVQAEESVQVNEQESFVRQTPEEIISAEPSFNEDLNPNIPAWARSAQAKARANRPDLANAKPTVSRSRFADTVAARLTEESINGSPVSNPSTPAFVAENQTDLQVRLAELREDIETVASTYAEQVDQNVATAQEAFKAEEPVAEPVSETPVAEIVSRETIAEAPVMEQAEEAAPAPVDELTEQVEAVEEVVEEPHAGRGNRVVTPIALPTMAPTIKVAEIEPNNTEDEVDSFQEEMLQDSDESVEYSEYAEEIQEAFEEQPIEDVIEAFDEPVERAPRRRSVRGGSIDPEPAGIAGKFSSFASKFGKSFKEKTSSLSFGKRKEETIEDVFADDFDDIPPAEEAPEAQAFTLRDSSKAGRVAIGGPAADTAEELIEEEINPESTASLSPMDVSAFLNDIEPDEEYAEDFDDEYIEEEVQDEVELQDQRKSEAELQEEVARKIAAADTNPVSLEDIMSAVQMEMHSERTGIPIPKEAAERNFALNLPSITGSFTAVQEEDQQKPVVLPSPTVQDSANQAPGALVSSMIPRIGSDGNPVAKQDSEPAPAPAPVDEAEQTQMFAPQQEEEYYGEFPAPVVEEAPKKGFFSRFRKKKKQEDDMGVAAWIGADDDYSAREVGRQRGSWESFKQDEVDDFAPTTRFAPVENDDFAPVNNDNFAPIDNDGFAPIDNDGFAPIDFNNSAFRNPRDWNGGGLSLDRLKGMKDNLPSMPSLPGRKNKEQGDDEGRGRSSRGGATSGRSSRAGRSSGRVRPSYDAMDAEAVDGELKKINSFKNGAVDTEIWFVALGSTIPNNAGMKAFLDEHGEELKGATIINIEALGAGSLSFIQHEGKYKGVQATSRFKRYLRQASQASGISFSTGKLEGVDTPATVAMKRGYQAVSLVGMEKGKKALSSSAEDVVENIDPQILKDNSNFVLNLLKSI